MQGRYGDGGAFSAIEPGIGETWRALERRRRQVRLWALILSLGISVLGPAGTHLTGRQTAARSGVGGGAATVAHLPVAGPAYGWRA